MGETALLIFSLCLQAAIGTMLFITLGKQLYKDKLFKRAALTTAILSIAGVLASLAHLGQPLLAFNSLFNLGSSWLSKEVLFSGTFMGIAVLYALVIYLKPTNQTLATGLRWAGSVVGVCAVFSMAKVYTTSIVPVWQGANTYVDFFATTIAVGALIFIAASIKELQNVDKKIYGFIVLATVVIQAAVAVPYAINLGLHGQAAQASAEILSGLTAIIGLKWLLVLGGAGILVWPATQKAETKEAAPITGMIYIAVVSLVIGEMLGRFVFYAAIVASTVGLT